jgi:hypothetical protein
MLGQPNCAKTPNAALNIAELADRYASLLYGIGRRYRLTPEECDDAAQSTGLALCQNADHIRDPQCVAGWLATTCAGSPPQHSGAGTGSCPPPTPTGLFDGTRDSRVGASDNRLQTEMRPTGDTRRAHSRGATWDKPIRHHPEAATLSMTRVFPDRSLNGSRSLRQVAQESAAEGT